MGDKQDKPKIACYGFVEKNAGSVASANFLVLEEMLNRGYRIDFYGIKNFVYPEAFLKYINFTYTDVSIKAIEDIWRLIYKLPNFTKSIIAVSFSQITFFIYYRKIKREVNKSHSIKKYGLFLFLGLAAPFRIDGLPTISWIQAPPQTEWEAIKKNKNAIITLCGRLLYLKLKSFYVYKRLKARRELKKSDIVICGSRWSIDKLIAFGLNKDSVKALPYPIDIDFFRQGESAISERKREKVFLWLGRIDPRKRLDLLLDAFALVLKERRDVYLKIVGRFPYAKGYRRFIDNFGFPDHIEYNEYIERTKIPELMNSVDILIQPSENENFGSSLAEALCCGKPVIAGPTNGTKDYAGSSVFAFNEYTPESLEGSMLKAIRSVEEDKEKIAYQARKTAEENFAVSEVVDKLEGLFKEVIGRRR